MWRWGVGGNGWEEEKGKKGVDGENGNKGMMVDLREQLGNICDVVCAKSEQG